MARPRNKDSFRLYKRKLRGRELFYCRFIDVVDGTIIATRSTGTSDERKAVKKALEILKTIPKNPLKKDPLFIDALLNFWQPDSEYAKSRELDGRTLSNAHIGKIRHYLSSLVKTYAPFAKLRLSQVTPRILDKWRSSVGFSNASRKGINHAINGIRVFLRWAFFQGFIPNDPTASFKYIAYKPKEKGALSLLEMGKIEALDWSDIRQKAALFLGFFCGLRRGEIRALKWKHIDLDNCIIIVTENFTDDDGLKEPKAGSSRLLPIIGTTLDILTELKRTNPYGGEPEDFVLPNVLREKPLAAITIKRGFERIMDAIGIDKAARERRRLSFHSMRHSFITRAREAGLSDFVVAALSGHKTTRMVDHYSHQTLTAVETARGSLEIAFKQEEKKQSFKVKEVSYEN
jgi:integrase